MADDVYKEARVKLRETSQYLFENKNRTRVHKCAASNGRFVYNRMIQHERNLFPDIKIHKEVSKYLYVRNTIMKLWYSRTQVELTLGKVLSELPRLKYDIILVSRIHSYLVRYGYINFGLFQFLIEPKIRTNKKVIIVGAGLAGLSAAQQLLKFGIDVIILEANTRVGGRIYTASHQSIGYERDFADLGAATVRSIKANPLGTLISQLDATPFLISNKIPLYNSKGLIQSSVRNTLMKHLFNHVIKLIGQANFEQPVIDGDGRELDLERSVFNMIQALEIENQYTRNKYWHTFGDKLSEIIQSSDERNTELVLSKCPSISSTAQTSPPKPTTLTQAEIEAKKYVAELYHKNQDRREKEEAAADENRRRSDYSRRSAPAEQYTVEQDMKLLNYHKAVYEGQHGAPLSFLSSVFCNMHEQYRKDSNNIELKEGLGILMRKLASPIEDKIQLGVKVTEIDYSKTGEVNVKFKKKGSDEVFFVTQGSCVLVTVPLGILKDVAHARKDCMKFIPNLPPSKVRAIKRMGWGHLNKVALWFDEQFWSTTAPCFGYLNEELGGRGNMYFFTSAPGSHVLTAMLSGKSAEFEKTDEEMMKECLSVLRNIFSEKKVPTPLKCVVSRWHQDMNIKGAMSYLRPGTNPGICDVLARTVSKLSSSEKEKQPKVYFGGEHTSRDFLGTLEGAFYSGIREAAKIAAGILGSPFEHLPDFKNPFNQVGGQPIVQENITASAENNTKNTESVSDLLRTTETSKNSLTETFAISQPLTIITETETVDGTHLLEPPVENRKENITEPLMTIMETFESDLPVLQVITPRTQKAEKSIITKLDVLELDEKNCPSRRKKSSKKKKRKRDKTCNSPPSKKKKKTEDSERHTATTGCLKMIIDKRSMKKNLILRLPRAPTTEKIIGSAKLKSVEAEEFETTGTQKLESFENAQFNTAKSMKLEMTKTTKLGAIRTMKLDSAKILKTKPAENMKLKPAKTVDFKPAVKEKKTLPSDDNDLFVKPLPPREAKRRTESLLKIKEMERKKKAVEKPQTFVSVNALEFETPTTRGRARKVNFEKTTDSNLDQDGNVIWAGRKILKPRKCAQESAEKTKVMQRSKKQNRKAAPKVVKKVVVVETPPVQASIYGITPMGNRKPPPTEEDLERDKRWSNPNRANYFPAWFTEGSKFLFRNPVGLIKQEPAMDFDVSSEDPCFTSLRRSRVRFQLNQDDEDPSTTRSFCKQCLKAHEEANTWREAETEEAKARLAVEKEEAVAPSTSEVAEQIGKTSELPDTVTSETRRREGAERLRRAETEALRLKEAENFRIAETENLRAYEAEKSRGIEFEKQRKCQAEALRNIGYEESRKKEAKKMRLLDEERLLGEGAGETRRAEDEEKLKPKSERRETRAQRLHISRTESLEAESKAKAAELQRKTEKMRKAEAEKLRRTETEELRQREAENLRRAEAELSRVAAAEKWRRVEAEYTFLRENDFVRHLNKNCFSVTEVLSDESSCVKIEMTDPESPSISSDQSDAEKSRIEEPIPDLLLPAHEEMEKINVQKISGLDNEINEYNSSEFDNAPDDEKEVMYENSASMLDVSAYEEVETTTEEYIDFIDEEDFDDAAYQQVRSDYYGEDSNMFEDIGFEDEEVLPMNEASQFLSREVVLHADEEYDSSERGNRHDRFVDGSVATNVQYVPTYEEAQTLDPTSSRTSYEFHEEQPLQSSNRTSSDINYDGPNTLDLLEDTPAVHRSFSRFQLHVNRTIRRTSIGHNYGTRSPTSSSAELNEMAHEASSTGTDYAVEEQREKDLNDDRTQKDSKKTNPRAESAPSSESSGENKTSHESNC